MTKVNVRGDWVLVTGASTGIGKEFAEALAARGAKLVICARSRERLEALADSLSTEVRVVVADLSNQAGISQFLRDVDALELPIRHIVNNAGSGGAGHFKQQDQAQIEKMMTLNCMALAQITRHFTPKLVAAGGGGFLQVASTASFFPTPFMAVYGATKAFVLSLSVALHEEVKARGVSVTVVCPGPVPTEFQERAGYRLTGDQERNKMSASEVVAHAVAAYERGQQVCVPGKMNAFQVFGQRIFSTVNKARMAAVVMRRSGRDKVTS